MAKDTSARGSADGVTAAADPRATGREARAELDARVAKAQHDALPAARRETQGQRDGRLERDRHAMTDRAAAVELAQRTEGARMRAELEDLTPAERAERIEAGRRAVLERQAAMDAAVAAEGRRQRGDVSSTTSDATDRG